MIMALALVAVCLITLPTEAKADTSEEELWGYKRNGTGVTIIYADESKIYGDVTIPSTLNGYPVTGIGSFAFEWNNITSVVVPEGVTFLDEYAFYSTSITSVVLPDSLTSIGEYAFAYCTGLERITIPNSVTIINSNAFCDCTALKTVTIGAKVEVINSEVFYGCVALENAYFLCSYEQWLNMFKGSGNNNLSNANRHYSHVHNYTEATCTSGNTCQECGDVYGKAKGHTWDGDCDEKCDSCDLTRVAAHDYKDATCTEPQICIKCEKRNGSALGHKYDNACDATCNRCSKERTVPGHKSNGGTVTKKATCTATGTKTYKCTQCNKTIKTDTIDKLSHKWNAGKVTKKATCKATGVKTFTCSACNGTKTESIKKITTHTYSNACDKSCNVCGKARTVPAHKYTNSCDTTCNECDTKRSTKHKYTNNCDTDCNVCKAKRSITHSYKTTTKKATLKKNGSVVKKCTVCSKVASNKTIKYPKTIKLSATSYTYDGKAKKPTVTVKDLEGKTISSSNYTVSYASGRKNAGTYKVTVKMKGNYTGIKTLTYKIKPITATKVAAKIAKTQVTYNGKAQLPAITLKDSSGRTLKKNTDYTVKLPSGRKNVGTYTVKITLKGNYSGTETIKYTIKPTWRTDEELVLGNTLKLGAKSNTTIKYSSSNSKVAAVDKKGTVTAKKAGTATITVKSGSVTQKIKVKVTKPSVSILTKLTKVGRGGKLQMRAMTNPMGQKVKWSVNNTKIASISSGGMLTGKSAGTVTVTATLTYKGKTYKDTYKVTVQLAKPKVFTSVSAKTKWAAYIAIDIGNDGTKPMKVLSKGTIVSSVSGKKEVIGLYNDHAQKCSSLTIQPGKTVMVLLEVDEKIWQNEKLQVTFYFEYDGETYSAFSYSGLMSINKCSHVFHHPKK